jgi:hypothetical protein
LRIAQLSAVTACLSGKEFQPKDFMPEAKFETVQTADQMSAQLKAITILTGGKIEVKHHG